MIKDFFWNCPYDGYSKERASSLALISSMVYLAVQTMPLDHPLPTSETTSASEGSYRTTTQCKRLFLKTFNKLPSLSPGCLDVESLPDITSYLTSG